MKRLPELMDSRTIQEETGLSASSARCIIRALPKVHVDGVRKTWVRRSDFWNAYREVHVQSGGGR